MSQKIFRCYDSHTHFWATGQVAEGLKLNQLSSAEGVQHLIIKKSYYRDHWLVGFGWNQNQWAQPKFPSKEILDRIFPDTPVFFSRVDGHASWINSKAILELQKKGYNFATDPQGGLIQRDVRGNPTGLLFDQAHINALLMLPDFSVEQHQHFFESSQKIFNRAGFTHLRDLSMNLAAWQMLKTLEDKNALTVCLDAFVTAESLNDLERVLREINLIKKEASAQMRLHGVKIFIDGSLGSQTAFLSETYLGSNKSGILIWSPEDIKKLLKQTWRAGLDVAIHCIGDQAVHTAVVAAREVSAEGILGRLHLEHVQILRPETLVLMKPLHITCYMQPCHWLSDHSWLKSTLSEKLVKNLFQWEQLRKNKIPFYFGSDSPIEKPSLHNTYQALNQSIEWGIPELQADWKHYHSHPDTKWTESWTEIEQEQIVQVYFKGEALL